MGKLTLLGLGLAFVWIYGWTQESEFQIPGHNPLLQNHLI